MQTMGAAIRTTAAALVIYAQLTSSLMQCYNASGIAVTSVQGVECVECNLQGYLDSSGDCVCPQPQIMDSQCRLESPQQAESVTTICNPGFCQDAYTGDCVLAAFGAACLECGAQGYIVGTSCACYLSSANPNAACALLVDTSYDQVIVTNYSRYACEFFGNKQLGFFANALECLLPALGPPPNQAFLQECNTYGGADPVLGEDSGFYTCGGHGTWNATAYACGPCDLGWQLQDSGMLGVDSEEVLLCTQCALPYGPPANCSVVWLPDPLDGALKECSGHGVFVGGACQCFPGSTLSAHTCIPPRSRRR
jgi:hypothetical protein